MGRKRKGKAAARVNSIGATDIRRQRGDVVTENVEVLNDGGVRTVLYNVDKVQSQLRRMFRRDLICAHQMKAGERFALDCEMATVSMKSCLNVGTGGDDPYDVLMPETVGGAEAARRAKAQLGPLKGIVQAVAVEGRPASDWAEQHHIPARSGIDFLKLGLSTLVRHYRLDCDCQSDVSAKSG